MWGSTFRFVYAPQGPVVLGTDTPDGLTIPPSSPAKGSASDACPLCTGIVLRDIDLRRSDGDGGEVQTVCNCAIGFDYGRVSPAADCLRSSTCGGAPDHRPDDDDGGKGKAVALTIPAPILHTEL